MLVLLASDLPIDDCREERQTMKKSVTAVETRAESGAINRPAGSISFLWLAILGLLFYLSSNLVAFAVEPSPAGVGASSVSMPSRVKASPSQHSWFYRIFHKPTWSEVLEQCKTPQDVCNLVSRFVGYRTEEIDHWSSARETWEHGRGDCEDFAVCIGEFCHELGFSVTVNLYFPSGLRGDGHAVAVGTWNGQMWMSSNGSYKEVASIDEVKETIAQMYGCSRDDMWGSVLAHADIERRLHTSSGPAVAAAGSY